MATTLQMVDPSDLTTVLFDFNDPTGVYGGPGVLRTEVLSNPVFGAPPWEFDRFEAPGLPGGTTTFQQVGLREMSFALRMRASSFDYLKLGVARLGHHLANGCTLKFVANGSTETRYIDVEPSPTPVLLDGRDLAYYEATQLFDTPQGVLLNLTVQPFLRSAALTPTANILNNPTLLRDADVNGTPNGWTTAAAMTGETVLASAEALQFTVADAAPQTVQQEPGGATGTVSSGQTWTLQYEARVVSSPTTGCKMQAWLDWHTAAHGFISATAGTLVQLTSQWQTVSHTATAPATTDHASVNLYMDNDNATSFTVQVRNAQFIQAASVQPFRVGDETVSMDVTSTGFATMMPVYNPSDAPAPCVFDIAAPDAGSAIVRIEAALRSSKLLTGATRMVDFLNGPHYAPGDATGNGWTVTLGTGVTDAGNYSRWLMSGDSPPMARGVKWTRTTLLDSLRGEHDVYARVRQGPLTSVIVIEQGSSTTNSSTYQTADIDFKKGRVYLCALQWGTTQTYSVSVAGQSITGNEYFSTSISGTHRTGLWYFVPTADTTGPVSWSLNTTAVNTQWCILEVTGLDMSVGGGSGQVQENSMFQTSATPSITMASGYADPRNLSLCVIAHAGTATVTPDSNMTELYDQVVEADKGLHVQYKLGEEATQSATLSASEAWTIWAGELAVAYPSYELQLRWSPHDQMPQTNTLGIVELAGSSQMSSFGWTMQRLGRISLPEDRTVTLGTLALELWGTCTTGGGGALEVNRLEFMPVDEQGRIEVPGGGTEVWSPTQMMSPVDNPAGGTAAYLDNYPPQIYMYLDNDTDNVGSGFITATGVHHSTWKLSISTNGSFTCKIRVRNITDSTDTFVETISVPYGATRTFTRSWVAAASKTYQLQVDDPNPYAYGLNVWELSDVFAKSVAQNERIRSDPGSTPNRYNVERLTSAGALVTELQASTVPFMLPPGLSIVKLMVLDLPLQGYDDPQSVDGRTVTVTPTVYPRVPL